jgi:hypothetical protein
MILPDTFTQTDPTEVASFGLPFLMREGLPKRGTRWARA